MEAILKALLDALPYLAGPLAVWFATWLVLKLKPALSGKTIVVLVVPFFSFLATAIASYIGTTVNPVLLIVLNTSATFVAEFLKQWKQGTENPPA